MSYLRFVALFLIAALALCGCEPSYTTNSQPSEPFTDVYESFVKVQKCLQNGSLILKVYYLSYDILTRAPLNANDLRSDSLTEIITIENGKLQKHGEQLSKLQKVVLLPTGRECVQNVRLCYVFETADDGAVLEVAFNHTDGSVLINGVEVQYDDIFYDIVRPFLTQDMVDVHDSIFASW